MRKHLGLRIGGIVVAVLASAGQAMSAQLASCADVSEYFRNRLPAEAYARVQDLESAVEVVKRLTVSARDACEDWVIERAHFEYAIALEEYSKVIPGQRSGSSIGGP